MTINIPDQEAPHAEVVTAPAARKPFTSPRLKREACMAIVTAGSFDLIIPGGV